MAYADLQLTEQSLLLIYIIVTAFNLIVIFSVWCNRHADMIARRLPSAVIAFLVIMSILIVNFVSQFNVPNYFNEREGYVYAYIIVCYAGVSLMMTTFSLRAAHILFTYALGQARLGHTDFGLHESSPFERKVMRITVRLVFQFFTKILALRRKMMGVFMAHGRSPMSRFTIQGPEGGQSNANHEQVVSRQESAIGGNSPLRLLNAKKGTSLQQNTPSMPSPHTTFTRSTQSPTAVVDLEMVRQLSTIKSSDLLCLYLLVTVSSTILCGLTLLLIVVSGSSIVLQGSGLPNWVVTRYHANPVVFIPLVSLTVACIMPCQLIAILIRDMPDPLFMRFELMAALIPFILGAITYLHDYIFQTYQVFKEGYTVWLAIFAFMQIWGCGLLPLVLNWHRQSKVQVQRKESLRPLNKSDNSTTTSQSTSKQNNDYALFLHTLETPNLYNQLKNICANAMVIENILFHESFLKFQKQFQTNEIKDTKFQSRMQQAAIQLYNEYLKPDAQYELNIPSHVSNAVRTAIKEEKYSVEMFDIVHKQVLRMLCMLTHSVIFMFS